MPYREDVEEWRPVVGYEGYYDVSNLGSIMRTKAARGTFVGRIIKSYLNCPRGYPRVRLCKDKEHSCVFVHVLVAEAFIGPPPAGMEINHIDGNRMNPSAKNLEYLTAKENCRHAFDSGLRVPMRGERQGNSKLTERGVREILGKLGSKPQSEIAIEHSVSKSLISHIATRRAWWWLEPIA